MGRNAYATCVTRIDNMLPAKPPLPQLIMPTFTINLHKNHPCVALNRNAGVLSVFVTEQ